MPNLPFSEFGSQSNTNSKSTKSTVFRIGTNQTHPKCAHYFVVMFEVTSADQRTQGNKLLKVISIALSVKRTKFCHSLLHRNRKSHCQRKDDHFSSTRRLASVDQQVRSFVLFFLDSMYVYFDMYN